ncbi:hypothetical protein [Marinomonas sp. 2405UD68-3]|uniref:hypothetical protein n=1 Tax=Marinomonas sp. 2405UD68-3 TaxID=3391835 RepID=UPI0039C95EBE
MKWIFLLFLLGNVGFFAWHELERANIKVVEKNVYAPPVSQKILTLEEAPEEGVVDEAVKQNVPVRNDLEAQLKAIIDNAAVNNESTTLYCPFVETEKTQDRAQLLQKMQESGWRYREETFKRDTMKYWLYIAAPASRAQAAAIMNELKQKNIDSFRITRGEMKNRISLGLYSIQKTAKEEELRIESLVNYPVDIFEHTRAVTIFKIQFVDKITNVQLDELVNWAKTTKMMINVEKKLC